MTFRQRLMARFRRQPPPLLASAPPAPPQRCEVPRSQPKPPIAVADLLRPYQPPPGIAATGGLAMDEALFGGVDVMGGWANDIDFDPDGLSFPGYPVLALMANRAENRKAVETLATEATREWIELKGKGDDDKTDHIAELSQALDDFRVRDILKRGVEHDGYFGMGHIFIDVKRGAADQPLVIGTKGIGQGDLRGFRNVEPYWTSAYSVPAQNPLDDRAYRPSKWNVSGRVVDASRLLTIVGREVPDMLKPAFNYGGMAATQLAKAAVANYLRTRGSVSDMVSNFSTMVLQTNLETLQMPAGPGGGIVQRVMDFVTVKSNNGMFLCDKEEEVSNVSAPLGGLDGLQAQAQEAIAAYYNIPLVKYWGITPTGLNPTSDGEIRVFYDYISAFVQEGMIRRPLTAMLDILQLHLWGEIDPDITFQFVPLWQMDAAAKASIEKTKADTDAVLIGSGVIAQEESRQRIAADEDSMYHGLDLEPEALPETPEGDNDNADAGVSGDPAAGKIGESGV